MIKPEEVTCVYNSGPALAVDVPRYKALATGYGIGQAAMGNTESEARAIATLAWYRVALERVDKFLNYLVQQAEASTDTDDEETAESMREGECLLRQALEEGKIPEVLA
jgi:hypothetical protein